MALYDIISDGAGYGIHNDSGFAKFCNETLLLAVSLKRNNWACYKFDPAVKYHVVVPWELVCK